MPAYIAPVYGQKIEGARTGSTGHTVAHTHRGRESRGRTHSHTTGQDAQEQRRQSTQYHTDAQHAEERTSPYTIGHRGVL